MSYILDALRRAQAERERGQVPGLHAQPGLGATQRMRPASGTPSGRPAWVWALAGAGVVVLLLVPFLLLTRSPSPAQPAVAAAPTALPAAPPTVLPAGVAAAPAPQPPPLVVVAAPPPAPTLVTRNVTAGGAVAPSATVTSAAALPAGRSSATPPAAAAPRAAASEAGPSAQAVHSPAQSPAQSPVPAGQEAATASTAPLARTPVVPAAGATPPAALPAPLTAEQRRDWPPLAVGGSVWSDSASARFVILGGQLVREGETTADGVLVERITPKAVVLRWRDQRGSLPF